MASSTDERDRILYMVESGKVTAAQAAQLLDTLDIERSRSREQSRNRTARVRVTNLATVLAPRRASPR